MNWRHTWRCGHDWWNVRHGCLLTVLKDPHKLYKLWIEAWVLVLW